MAAMAIGYTTATNGGANAPACGYQCAPRGRCTLCDGCTPRALCTPRGGQRLRLPIPTVRLGILVSLMYVIWWPAGVACRSYDLVWVVGTASNARWASHAVR